MLYAFIEAPFGGYGLHEISLEAVREMGLEKLTLLDDDQRQRALCGLVKHCGILRRNSRHDLCMDV